MPLLRVQEKDLFIQAARSFHIMALFQSLLNKLSAVKTDA
jgi:hypothetical protein